MVRLIAKNLKKPLTRQGNIVKAFSKYMIILTEINNNAKLSLFEIIYQQSSPIVLTGINF